MGKLFGSFKAVTAEVWNQRLNKDLKDNAAALLSYPEPGIELPANLHGVQFPDSTVSRNLQKTTAWKICAEFETTAGNNRKILKALNGGVDCLSLQFTNQKEFEAGTKGVMFQHIDASLSFTDSKSAEKFPVHKNIRLRFDPISSMLENGEFREIHEFSSFFKSGKNQAVVHVDGDIYGNAGASSVQELGFSIAHLNEYLQQVHSDGIEIPKIIDRIEITLSCGSNYLVNIAKFRALRELVDLVLQGHGVVSTEKRIGVTATTGTLFITKNDRYNNLLRLTGQCMSAILGGCDEVIVAPYDKTDELSCRMANNIQLILREESYFDKVIDPAGGAYIIEHLTDQLIQKAWAEFLEIEKSGGLISAMKAGSLQKKISDNLDNTITKLNSGESTFIAVNKFRNPVEKWITTDDPKSNPGKDFEKLVPIRLENLLSEVVTNKA